MSLEHSDHCSMCKAPGFYVHAEPHHNKVTLLPYEDQLAYYPECDVGMICNSCKTALDGTRDTLTGMAYGLELTPDMPEIEL